MPKPSTPRSGSSRSRCRRRNTPSAALPRPAADDSAMADAGRVLITGATGGAGSGVLAAFLEAGWRVAAASRREPPDEPPGVAWVRADLVDAAAAQRMVADTVAALGGLDAIVCLAGGYSRARLEELSWADFEAQIGTSLRPTVESVLAALPAL